MSYEGSKEFLCERGHRSGCDCWDDDPTVCRCGAMITHHHSIDHTNGVIEDDPSTMSAPVREIGFDDVWHEDHHGNRYATKMVRYEPLEHWRVVKPLAVSSEPLSSVAHGAVMSKPQVVEP